MSQNFVSECNGYNISVEEAKVQCNMPLNLVASFNCVIHDIVSQIISGNLNFV